MAQSSRPTQEFVPVKEVRDGIIVMKDETLCAAVIVSSINLSLKSYDEQRAILMQFQNFLNTLDFPLQILIQSRRYDVRPYIVLLQNRLKDQKEQLLQVQTREYIQFIQAFTESQNIMRKSFYVVVPYTPPIVSQKGSIGKLFSFLNKVNSQTMALKDFEEQRTQLEERLSVVEQGLSHLGLRSVQLGTQETIELLYKTFNPGETTTDVSAGEA